MGDKLREAAQMALDVLEDINECSLEPTGIPLPAEIDEAMDSLRSALAQPEQEPVAWKDAPSKIYLQVCEESDCDQPFDSHIEVSWCQDKINDSDIPYVRADAAPPQRDWQGLTDEEIEKLVYDIRSQTTGVVATAYVARAIEARLKEKNNG